MRLPTSLYNFYRRRFGRYEIDDPRPVAESAPYTFYMPSDTELAALAPGDLIQLVFRSIPPGRQWEAERMWVKIETIARDRFTGRLSNLPSDMPQLRLNSLVEFQRHHVISIDWSDERMTAPPPSPPRRKYWERCFVDRCVTDDGIPVHYIYREEPEPATEGDTYPDSGWRIRGDYRNLTDEEIEAREFEYIALGKVLNADDSWIHLIDAPIGSAFIRDWETGTFVSEA